MDLKSGYVLHAEYVTQVPLFVTEVGRPQYRLTKPGDGVPTLAEWDAGMRKRKVLKVIAFLPKGTVMKNEKIIHLKATGSGVSHVTGLFRAQGVDRLISPFSVSTFKEGRNYGTICVPDDRFIRIKE